VLGDSDADLLFALTRFSLLQRPAGNSEHKDRHVPGSPTPGKKVFHIPKPVKSQGRSKTSPLPSSITQGTNGAATTSPAHSTANHLPARAAQANAGTGKTANKFGMWHVRGLANTTELSAFFSSIANVEQLCSRSRASSLADMVLLTRDWLVDGDAT